MRTGVFVAGAMASLILTIASLSYGATNLNSSRSNIYRLVYAPVVTPIQATAILAEVDKAKPRGDADEATVRAIVHKHVGAIKSARRGNLVIIVRPASGAQKLKTILILEDAADEAAALAVSDEGASGPKPVKGKTGAK
jgi:hypothetical protein